jgi:hypothetical protein
METVSSEEKQAAELGSTALLSSLTYNQRVWARRWFGRWQRVYVKGKTSYGWIVGHKRDSDEGFEVKHVCPAPETEEEKKQEREARTVREQLDAEFDAEFPGMGSLLREMRKGNGFFSKVTYKRTGPAGDAASEKDSNQTPNS